MPRSLSSASSSSYEKRVTQMPRATALLRTTVVLLRRPPVRVAGSSSHSTARTSPTDCTAAQGIPFELRVTGLQKTHTVIPASPEKHRQYVQSDEVNAWRMEPSLGLPRTRGKPEDKGSYESKCAMRPENEQQSGNSWREADHHARRRFPWQLPA